MADTTTTNLGLTKPEVGASADTWGTKLNTDLDLVDALFAAAGNGTSVGLNVGSGKTIAVAGTLNVTGTVSGGVVATLASPTFTGTVTLPSTTSIGSVSDTEIGYLDGVTSAIQTQLNSKQATLVSGTSIKTVGGASLLGSGDVGTIGVAYGGTGVTTSTGSGSVVLSTSPTIATPTITGAVTSSDLADAVGYKGLPQNSQTSSYTLALSDQGKHISITTGGVVIPANGSVAFPIGATIVVFNNSGSNQTISITTDTLRQAGTANTGSRTLAQYGVATLIKVASTVWVVTGAGIS